MSKSIGLDGLSFWDHLDELRKIIFRMLIVVAIFMVIAFTFKDFLFTVIFAPSKHDFILYKGLCKLSDLLSFPAICPESFEVELINTQLAAQFFVHMKVSMLVGVLCATPYIIFQLFRFISPALYSDEKKYSRRVIFYSIILFFGGVLLNYFLIFPLSFRFLANYQVNEDVVNMINLSSYIDTLLMLSLMIGIMSEIPIISWLLAKLGLLTDVYMRKYRRHAIVAILIIAAVITPTVDIFTLALVFFPIYFLYELSILIVKRSEKKRKKKKLSAEN